MTLQEDILSHNIRTFLPLKRLPQTFRATTIVKSSKALMCNEKFFPTEFRQTADLSDVLIYNASILNKEIEHLAGNNFPPISVRL